MSREWARATSQDNGNTIYINIDRAAAIENRKSGARIWFKPGDKESVIDVSETAEEILGPLGEIEIIHTD
jgi:hypothetical protein